MSKNSYFNDTNSPSVQEKHPSVQEMSYFKRSIQASKSKCPREDQVSKRALVTTEGEEGGEGGRGGRWWLGFSPTVERER